MRIVGVLSIVLALVAGCQTQAVNNSIERSTSPVLVPTGEWRDDFEFTAPPGATDLYQLRWNFRAGATDVVTGWQVAVTSTYDQARIAEGPGQQLVDEALTAARGEGCQIADRATGLQLCTYQAEFSRGGVKSYLVRLLQNQILVIDYNHLEGDPSVYNPDTLEARFVNADFDAIPIDDATDAYLVYIY